VTPDFNNLRNWHALCKLSGIGVRVVRMPIQTGRFPMTAHFDAVQRFAASTVAALVFAAVLVAAAVPVVPIA
jgi:hypothetical protein